MKCKLESQRIRPCCVVNPGGIRVEERRGNRRGHCAAAEGTEPFSSRGYLYNDAKSRSRKCFGWRMTVRRHIMECESKQVSMGEGRMGEEDPIIQRLEVVQRLRGDSISTGRKIQGMKSHRDAFSSNLALHRRNQSAARTQLAQHRVQPGCGIHRHAGRL